MPCKACCVPCTGDPVSLSTLSTLSIGSDVSGEFTARAWLRPSMDTWVLPGLLPRG